jgi:tumor protein p53-inducible protein 3
MGLECAGEVIDHHTMKPTGERVMALLPGGGYAQYAKVLRSHTMPLFCENMTWIEAAAIPEVWLTAFQLLFVIGNAKAGETALVHAAASGVGTAMLQLCRTYDVNTIAVASKDEKLA